MHGLISLPAIEHMVPIAFREHNNWPSGIPSIELLDSPSWLRFSAPNAAASAPVFLGQSLLQPGRNKRAALFIPLVEHFFFV